MKEWQKYSRLRELSNAVCAQPDRYMALAYGSYLHLGIICNSFLKMTKEVVYFKRLVLIMNINFPLPLSIVKKKICPQIVSKYLPRTTTTIKLLKTHTVKNTFLRRIWESLNMKSLRREGICQLLHSLVFKSFSLLCSLLGVRPHPGSDATILRAIS